jgi:hypothetical protein
VVLKVTAAVAIAVVIAAATAVYYKQEIYLWLLGQDDFCKWIINYYDTIKKSLTPNYMNKYN